MRVRGCFSLTLSHSLTHSLTLCCVALKENNFPQRILLILWQYSSIIAPVGKQSTTSKQKEMRDDISNREG